ncbi:MAG: hypothetical protein MJ177_11065 [Clostridia bacterium]|nr:hypothetical protein [Clostridia bacterium]
MSNSKLSKKDIVLVGLLAVIVIGVVYYMCFLTPLKKEISSVSGQCGELDLQITELEAKAASMDGMQKELDEIFKRPKKEITEIAPYDNAKTVMNFLNGILARSNEYSLSSPDPVIGEDGMVRRVVNLSFTCSKYSTAKSILKSLASWNYRCLLGNVTVSAGDGDDGNAASVNKSGVSVSATMTFFESQKIN